jgi:hypothetical protein
MRLPHWHNRNDKGNNGNNNNNKTANTGTTTRSPGWELVRSKLPKLLLQTLVAAATGIKAP